MWIAMAWQCISSEVSVKGFKQFCVSNAMDTTDIYIYMMWNGSKEDRNVRS
jgi:hypothetical protein